MRRVFVYLCLIFGWSGAAIAQTLQPASVPTASPATGEEETIVPTFETQKLARTYILDIPAPRGQIVDRNGAPLAQNRLSYNLGFNFPTPLDFSDAQAAAFAREKIALAEKLLGRSIKIPDETILRHYRNRGVLPFEIAQNLTEAEYKEVKDEIRAPMIVRPIYVRVYPNGKLGGQIVGYTGKTGRNLDGIIVNGGTGIAARDSTIEVVRMLLDKELEGFGELFRYLSYQEIGSAAMLSRALAGVAAGKIVAALPGSPDACRLAMEKLLIPELGHMAYLLKL